MWGICLLRCEAKQAIEGWMTRGLDDGTTRWYYSRIWSSVLQLRPSDALSLAYSLPPCHGMLECCHFLLVAHIYSWQKSEKLENLKNLKNLAVQMWNHHLRTSISCTSHENVQALATNKAMPPLAASETNGPGRYLKKKKRMSE